MANTFKTVTFAAEPASAGTPYVMYTAGSGVTAVVLGLNICNKDAAEQDVTVKLTSNTSNRTGANNAANEDVTLLNEVVIPADSTLEVFAGQKIVVETTDVVTIGAKTASKLDAALSVMEIT